MKTEAPSSRAQVPEVSSPLVSVVLPVRNGERFVAAALASVQAQTFPHFECIVVDDGSQDGTADLLERVAREDLRMRVVHQPPSGLVAALNRGCALARGRYVARMDADDLALPSRLQRQLTRLESDPGLVALGGAVQCIDALDRALPPEPILTGSQAIERALLRGDCPITHPTVLMRRADFEAVGGYRRCIAHAEDYDLWLRLVERGRLDNLPEPVLRYRRHPQQVSIRHHAEQALSNLAARASARARRAGEPDPLAGVDALDDTVFARLGLDARQRAQAVARAMLTAIGSLREAGELPAAQALLAHLQQAARAHPLPPSMQADLRLARAALAWRQRRPWAAAAALAQALLGRPRLAMRPLKPWWPRPPQSS